MSAPLNGMPEFYVLLDEVAETHHRKSHDYASNDNPSGNYHFAGKVALLFAHSEQDAGFVGRIAEKIYRLANLEKSSKAPLNEAIDDTEKDIVTIAALWMADRRRRRTEAIKKQITEQYQMAGMQGAAQYNPEFGLKVKRPESCNMHDRYEIGCKDCRSINGLG